MTEIVELDAPGGEDPDVAFAGVDEIAARVGREFTDAETAQVEMLLTLAASQIAIACDQDEAWAAALDPVPSVLRIVSIEAVVRVVSNPKGVRSEQETLGAHSRSQSFHDSTIGLELKPSEVHMVRRAVNGSLTGSATLKGLPDQLFCGDDEA